MGIAAPELRRDCEPLGPSWSPATLVWKARRDSRFAVVGIVLAVYLASLVVAIGLGHHAGYFVFIGQTFLDRSEVSEAIESNAGAASAGTGYDGQFSLFIAQDPTRAHAYIDSPSYRYGRILYPLTARASATALGVSIPTALIAINVLAVVGCVLALALWLRRRGSSPWLALLVGLSPGMYVAVFRDLSDVLAYLLVVVAVLVAERTHRRALLASAVIFALAILTRETTAVFALIWAAALIFRGQPGMHWRRGALFATIALAPALIYRGMLVLWLGDPGMPAELRPRVIPFGGILGSWPWNLVDALHFTLVVVPGTLCLAVAALALHRGVREPAVIAIAANALLYVVMLPEPVFAHLDSSLRAPLGVVIALVLAAPALKEVFRGYRLRLLIPAIAPIYAMTLLFAYVELW